MMEHNCFLNAFLNWYKIMISEFHKQRLDKSIVQYKVYPTYVSVQFQTNSPQIMDTVQARRVWKEYRSQGYVDPAQSVIDAYQAQVDEHNYYDQFEEEVMG